MSFFVRTASGKPRFISRGQARLLTTLVLAAYPAGTLTMLLMPDTNPTPGLVLGEIIGFALLIVSLIAFALLARSQFQRITGEVPNILDEREMDLRRRAYTFAYQVFTALTLIGIVYIGIGGDLIANDKFQVWLPSTYDHWNAVFWGAIIYAFVLPTAYLAWTAPEVILDDDAE